MSYRKTESDHHSPEQVRQYLDTALRLTAEMDVPDDLRVAFFTQAVGLVSAKQLFFEQVGAVPLLDGARRRG